MISKKEIQEYLEGIKHIENVKGNLANKKIRRNKKC